jgi:Rrf2 family transcriptional regulator, iron-sulfur cluster assembly transcription factor
MFSRRCEYGIRACIYIAAQADGSRRVNIQEIAAAIRSPEAFTSKILQQLVHAGLITSHRGIGGGFSLDPGKAGKISLSDIAEALEGPETLRACVLGLDNCSSLTPCPAHHTFAEVRDRMNQALKTTTLGELADPLVRGETHLRSTITKKTTT